MGEGGGCGLGYSGQIECNKGLSNTFYSLIAYPSVRTRWLVLHGRTWVSLKFKPERLVRNLIVYVLYLFLSFAIYFAQQKIRTCI